MYSSPQMKLILLGQAHCQRLLQHLLEFSTFLYFDTTLFYAQAV